MMREEEEVGIFMREALKARAQLRDSSAVHLREGCTMVGTTNPLGSAAGSPSLCPILMALGWAVPQLLLAWGIGVEENLGRAWGGQRRVPVCLLQVLGLAVLGLMISEVLSSLSNPVTCGRSVVCPKHKHLQVWWLHAELVRGDVTWSVPSAHRHLSCRQSPLWGTV